MAEFHILNLEGDNGNNKRIFDALWEPYIDAAQCIKLPNPKDDSEVKDFIRANEAHFLPESQPYKLGGNVRYIFSADGNVVTAPPLPVAKPAKDASDADKLAYQTYVAKAHKLIIADIESGKLTFSMDPKHKIAVLFRADNAKPWSIITSRIIRKIDYVQDLLKHPGVPGLDHLLGIHTFINASGEKTEILTRYYKAEFKDGRPDEMFAAAMYVKYANGDIDRIITSPEDEYLSHFKPVAKFLEAAANKYGSHNDNEEVLKLGPTYTQADMAAYVERCRKFISDSEEHFVIYRNDQTTTNQNIFGNYQQKDLEGNPLIQDDNASSLDYTLQQTLTTFRTTIDANGYYKPSVAAWQKHKYNFIEKIEAVPQGVKVEFKDKSYIVDTGNKLTLHGSAEDLYLKAMVLHAKEHWGNQFKIDKASTTVRAKLIQLAGDYNVTIVDNAPTRPDMPRPKPFANVQTPIAA